MNYFFGVAQSVLPDGRSLGIVMNDGIGNIRDGVSKVSSEDFLTLDGKAYKMHVTELTETDAADLLSQKHLKTVGDSEASCDLLYTPKFENSAQKYLIFLAFSFKPTFGHFTGQCTINNETL